MEHLEWLRFQNNRRAPKLSQVTKATIQASELLSCGKGMP
jgi:hypothetical protein